MFRPISVRPTIQSKPVSTTVLEGNSVTFNCSATGVPPPRISWEFTSSGNAPLELTSTSSSSSQFMTRSTLVLSNVSNNDSYEGMQTCLADNKVGSGNVSFSLVVHGMFIKMFHICLNVVCFYFHLVQFNFYVTTYVFPHLS